MMQKKGSYSNYDGKEFGRILEFCPVVLPHSPHADITSEHEIFFEINFLGTFVSVLCEGYNKTS